MLSPAAQPQPHTKGIDGEGTYFTVEGALRPGLGLCRESRALGLSPLCSRSNLARPRPFQLAGLGPLTLETVVEERINYCSDFMEQLLVL